MSAGVNLAHIEKYVNSSNDAFDINFTRDGKDVFPESFNPRFTYTLFSDQKIIGYTDPVIRLRYDALTMQPSIDFSYDEQFKAIGKTKAMNVNKILRKAFPASAFDGISKSTRPAETSTTWTPPGDKVADYTIDGRRFQIWCSSLSDSRARTLLTNMRMLVPLMIDGGTPCTYVDDPPWSVARWKLWLVYELERDLYTPVGFSTSYRLWVFPSREIRTWACEKNIPRNPEEKAYVAKFDENDTPIYDEVHPAPAPYARALTPPLSLPQPAPTGAQNPFEGTYDTHQALSRERISQFIIFPYYQQSGHGAALYDSMVKAFRADKDVFEIVIEEPSEAMDALRDYQDFTYLRGLPEFTAITIPDRVPPETLARDQVVPRKYIVDEDKLEELRWKAKLIDRQFMRMVEMQLYTTIPAMHRSNDRLVRKDKAPNANDRRYYFFKMLMAYRVYMKHVDDLTQFDRHERPAKVYSAVDSQIEEYVERLEGLAKREKRSPVVMNGEQSTKKRKAAGRVIIDDDDDDDDGGVNVSSKRAKVG